MGESRFHEVLDAAPDGILQVDAVGNIVLVNRALENMFGYTREELLGSPVEKLIPREQRAAHQTHRSSYRQNPSTRPMGAGVTLEGQRRDGSLFPVEISLSPSPVGDPDFFATAIIRDVTERKYNESLLRAEQEVRTRELERANRLKSEFMASMSHELRTPLHTIIGFSELLAEELQGPLNEKQKRFVNHIHKDSLHLLELINDVLDLSKIEAGRMELRPEPFDLVAVIDESLAAVKVPVLEKSLVVTKSIEVVNALEADRIRVKQVLVNLLSNAAKFTPAQGHIHVHAEPEGANVKISVTDTGVGIPREEHEAIFDKFYQTGVTPKGVREGTGLGLAITKQLVEQHGGSIHVESSLGKGSVFTVRLPQKARGGAQ